jgi:hypothetical protein
VEVVPPLTRNPREEEPALEWPREAGLLLLGAPSEKARESMDCRRLLMPALPRMVVMSMRERVRAGPTGREG